MGGDITTKILVFPNGNSIMPNACKQACQGLEDVELETWDELKQKHRGIIPAGMSQHKTLEYLRGIGKAKHNIAYVDPMWINIVPEFFKDPDIGTKIYVVGHAEEDPENSYEVIFLDNPSQLAKKMRSHITGYND